MYDTDQEQIEALQTWWSKYGNWVIAAFIIFIAAYVGVQLYQNARENHRIEASVIYDELSASLADSENTEKQQELIDALKRDYSDLGYGAMAALIAAKIDVDAGDFEAALSELDWARKNSDDELLALVQYRKAQVEFQLGELDAALSTLAAIEGTGHEAVTFELKGDVLFEQGDIEAARQAYQTAYELSSEQSINNPYLKIKLDDLAVAE
ncbi:YfgM family protein [Reinekea thalattae]|uniref:YfgM family protein n=1 Tax=Reinekea thalattae TaxID=2593301 RepID=UPI001650793E|nr:tetratricopeptide repeat protein [Reinekea thalattae]